MTEPSETQYRIGEVSDLTGIKPHVLRYWESEFPMLAPPKSSSQQRLYRQQDIDAVLLLKKLLYEEGYTIAGARAKLKSMPQGQMLQDTAPSMDVQIENVSEMKATLMHVRRELLAIRDMLEAQGNTPLNSVGNA